MFSKEKKVYNLLQDEESKNIFFERIKYSIIQPSINNDNINLNKFMFKHYKDVNTYIHNKLNLNAYEGNHKVIFYGAGKYAQTFLNLFENDFGIEVELICDKNAVEKKPDFPKHIVITPPNYTNSITIN